MLNSQNPLSKQILAGSWGLLYIKWVDTHCNGTPFPSSRLIFSQMSVSAGWLSMLDAGMPYNRNKEKYAKLRQSPLCACSIRINVLGPLDKTASWDLKV